MRLNLMAFVPVPFSFLPENASACRTDVRKALIGIPATLP
jgi:hypothetical protein